MASRILGLDISKATFHAALLKNNKKDKAIVQLFDNNWDGFEALQHWLQEHGAHQVHACLEATSVYGHPVATYLFHHGHQVSIVNPSRIKGFAQSRLSRTKNDRADAGIIAQFCKALKPQTWTPPAPEIARLQGYSRRLQALIKMKTQEQNRLKIAEDELAADIEEHIQFLEKKIEAVKKQQQQLVEASETLLPQQKLLTSIVGIGEATAVTILAELGSIEQFRSARQLAAFVGLTPQEHQSGSSVRGKTRLCKIGSPHLRKALYFPALSAIRHSPEIQALKAHFLELGKNKMQIVGIIMHKLIRVVYGVLKSGKPFDPNKLIPPEISLASS